MANSLVPGARVRIQGTTLYDGRVGTLQANSGDPEDFWDFEVDLDAKEVPYGQVPGPGARILEARTIGVNSFQVEVITEDE